MTAASVWHSEDGGIRRLLPSQTQSVGHGPPVGHALDGSSRWSQAVIEDGYGPEAKAPLSLERPNQALPGLTGPQDHHRFTPQPEVGRTTLHQIPQRRGQD